jgi:hypothetical protein
MSGYAALVATLAGALANATEIGWRNLDDDLKSQRASAPETQFKITEKIFTIFEYPANSATKEKRHICKKFEQKRKLFKILTCLGRALTKVAARLGDVRAKKSPIEGRIDGELLFHRVLDFRRDQDTTNRSYGIHARLESILLFLL